LYGAEGEFAESGPAFSICILAANDFGRFICYGATKRKRSFKGGLLKTDKRSGALEQSPFFG